MRRNREGKHKEETEERNKNNRKIPRIFQSCVK
jgi:hypothetical protein